MKRNRKELMNYYFVFIIMLLSIELPIKAQIGYQISLLNTATGEPRANETMNVTATITSSSGGVIWSGTQSVTSNDFGVLSLSVGNENTFKDLDLQQHKLPFYIEVSANGAMIGRSQVLSVPVAEVARKMEPLEIEKIIGYWKSLDSSALSLSSEGTFSYDNHGDKPHIAISGTYIIEGKLVLLFPSHAIESIGDSNYDASYLQGLAICYLQNGSLYVEHKSMQGRYFK